MLLVHKPQSFVPSSPPAFMQPLRAHRRNPSAPSSVVAVHPTKTPGLLSLSKPPQRPSPTNNSASHFRLASPRQPRAKPAQVPAPPAASPIAQEKPRGRSHQARDKAPRNLSRLRTHGGRSRQPSPVPIPSPADAAENSTPTNIVLPSPSPFNKPTAPVSAGRPARRRNRHISTPDALRVQTDFNAKPELFSTTPATSKASKRTSMPAKSKPVPMPIPMGNHRASSNPPATLSALHLSTSDPAIFDMGPRQVLQRASTEQDTTSFPICDDSFEFDRDVVGMLPPRTPVRRSPVTPLHGGYVSQVSDSDFDDSPRTTPQISPVLRKAINVPYTFPATSPIRRMRPPMSPTHARSNTGNNIMFANGRLPAEPTTPTRPTHVRAPSFPVNLPSASASYNSVTDLLFHMSMGSSSESDVDTVKVTPDDLFKKFGGKRRPQSQGPASSSYTPRPTTAQAQAEARALAYANSTFQNSPSPDVLPPPPRFGLP